MKLTGEALHAIVLEIAPGSAGVRTWEETHDQTRSEVEALASKIQEKYITPLEQLVLDWQRFVSDDWSDDFSTDEMSLRWEELGQRIRQLIGEGQA